MNRLALVKRFCMEAGISTTGPASTTEQTGEYLRNVGWVDSAYNSIQAESNMWSFLRDDFSFNTVSGTSVYSSAEHLITDVSSWIMRDIRVYSSVADESNLEILEWDLFRQLRLKGTTRTQTRRPSYIAEKPNMSLVLSPIPNAVFNINGEYYKTNDVMTTNESIPIFEEDFHMVIVWRALILSGAYSAENEKHVQGMSEYKDLMKKMKVKYLPKHRFGGSFA